MAYQYAGNGLYERVDDSSVSENSSRGFLFYLLRFEFILIACFGVLFFVKGLIVCLMEGNSIMGAISYAALWGFLPFVPLVLMGVFQIFLPRVISALFYIVLIPIICFYMLLIFPVVGHGRNPNDWMELTDSQKQLSMAFEAEQTLAIARRDPKSKEAKFVKDWESWNQKSYETYITDHKAKAVELDRQWEIDKAKQPSWAQPFYPR